MNENRSRMRFGSTAIATPANYVTIARVLFTVPTLYLIVRDGATWLNFLLWFGLSASDGVDGWMARRSGTTRSGAFLDPMADKFLTIGGFIALYWRHDIWWLPVALITAREVFVSVYRSLASKRGISLPARQLGKWKAFIQMIAVGVYLLPPFENLTMLKLATLWVAVAITIVSAADIVIRGWRENVQGV